MEEIIKMLNYQPNSLTQEELNNPLTVIGDFFECNELHKVRENLWELYTGWTNSYFTEGKENSEMLTLYANLINLINATYIYSERTKNKKAL